MQQIKVLVRNEELYQLLLLISLLDTDSLKGHNGGRGGQGSLLSSVVDLRQTYLRLYQRKYCLNNFNSGITYSAFKRATETIKIVAKFLEFFREF